MHPELLRIPILDIPVYTYGLLMATGILLGIWVFVRNGQQDGMDPAKLYRLALHTIVASLIGSRVLLIITEWETFLSHPERILSLDILRSGGVYYGGVLAGLLAVFYSARSAGYSWWRVGDALTPGLSLGLSVGRLGCFSAGCCWGKPTTLPWGVSFPEAGHAFVGVPVGIPLHPTQIYESILAFGLFLLLMRLRRVKRFDGQVLLVYLIGYAILRFVLEFLRDDFRGAVGPFSTSQFISLGLGLAAVAFLFLRRGHRSSPAPRAAT
ncbi:MAG: prolipoprotein diacylglyceryl transferase [Acidobacteria bacterium]|nr:prolipoprotein diacylglyceryl transferase [Acidobacteriota bacterium]